MKIGDLVRFVDQSKTRLDTLGMILSVHICKNRGPTLYEVEWYDDPTVGIDDYLECDLEVVSEGR